MVGKLILSIATGSFGVVPRNPASLTVLKPTLRSERFVTAPLCDECWDLPEEPARISFEHRVPEQCALCGDPTLSGIYRRCPASEVFYFPPAER